MPVIVISRGTLAGATQLAENVASELQIPCVSREIVVEAARAAGISDETLTKQMDRPPSYFDRASNARERDVYLWYVRAALCERAMAGSFVYHGHGGHLLLADIPNLIRVRVVAPMEYRIAAVMESQGLDAKAAEKHVHRMDRYRESWMKYLYGVDREDPSFYDLIINLEQLPVEDASKLLAQLARLERFEWTEEFKQKIADAVLATKVTAELAKSGELFLGKLELAATSNVLTIDGQARSGDARERIRSAAEKAVGDAELRFNVVDPAETITWGVEYSEVTDKSEKAGSASG